MRADPLRTRGDEVIKSRVAAPSYLLLFLERVYPEVFRSFLYCVSHFFSFFRLLKSRV